MNKGYKDSQIGEIPEDWTVAKLGEFGEFSKGRGIMKSEVLPNGLPCIRYGEIYTVHNFAIKEFYSFISEDLAQKSKLIKKNDIIFAGSGETVEDIGKAVVYLGEEEAYAGGDTIILSPKEDDNSMFLSYCLNDSIVTKQRAKFGQGNSVVHISSRNLAKLFIPRPPYSEQQKIADILTTVDDKLENIGAQIAEFMNLKKGLMQKLLVKGIGHTKFKNSPLGKIPEEWETEKMGRYAISFAGGTPARNKINYYKGNIPWVKSGEVNQLNITCTEEQISDLAITESSAKLIEPNSILVALYGATAGNVGMLRIQAASNQAVLAINSKVEFLLNEFLYHYLKQATSKLLNLTQGSGQPNLSKGIIDGLIIPIPSLMEQQKIAKILSSVDDKLESLQTKKEECAQLKKGLMEKLLTGKIRVKV